MKLSRSEFTQALSILTKVVEPRQTLPILTSVLLEPQDSGLRLTATDLEVGVVLNLSGEREPGDRPIALPAKKLAELVKALPKAMKQITITTDDTTTATVAGARIPWTAPDDFPSVVPTEAEPVAVPGLRAALQRVEAAVSHDESRYALNGVYLDLAKGAVVSTDGCRLHRVAVPAVEAPSAILPPKAVALLTGPLGRLMDQQLTPDGLAEQVAVTEKTCRIPLVNSGFLVARTIEGTFPDYEAIMPKPPYGLTAPREALVEAITAASTVAESRNKPVALILDATPSVYASDPETGQMTAPIEGATYDGKKALTVGFNARYLLAALDACEQETVTLRVNDDQHAAARIDDGAFSAVIMPMRIDTIGRPAPATAEAGEEPEERPERTDDEIPGVIEVAPPVAA